MARLSIAVLAIMLVLLSVPASSHGSSSGEVKKHHHGHHHGHHGHHGHGHGENHHHGHGHHMGSHHHGHHHHKHEHSHEHQDKQHKDGDKPHHHDGKTRKDGKPKEHGHSDHVHYWQDDGSLDLTKVPAQALKKSFAEWKKVFGKTYETPESESAHYATYLDNWGKIIDFNKQANQTFQMGMNQFSDLTSAQFKKYIHGGEGSCLRSSRKFWKETSSSLLSKAASAFQSIGSGGIVKANPESIDWTTKGVVTPVKNQGQCGSCWAFSTTGSLECRAAIKSGKLISLSEQQLVDCSRAEGNMGCNGGLMDDAFKYVKKEGGLCSESEYRYEGRDGVCKAATCGTKYDAITGYTDVPKDSATDLETAVVAGCVSVAIEADQSAFQFYKSGILSGRCGTRLDHGVLVVGYGEESGKKYWKVKNSWGKTWGEQGYVRICKECGKDAGRGECGILEQPSYPVV